MVLSMYQLTASSIVFRKELERAQLRPKAVQDKVRVSEQTADAVTVPEECVVANSGSLVDDSV